MSIRRPGRGAALQLECPGGRRAPDQWSDVSAWTRSRGLGRPRARGLAHERETMVPRRTSMITLTTNDMPTRGGRGGTTASFVKSRQEEASMTSFGRRGQHGHETRRGLRANIAIAGAPARAVDLYAEFPRRGAVAEAVDSQLERETRVGLGAGPRLPRGRDVRLDTAPCAAGRGRPRGVTAIPASGSRLRGRSP
jgi:hypothetical protein